MNLLDEKFEGQLPNVKISVQLISVVYNYLYPSIRNENLAFHRNLWLA